MIFDDIVAGSAVFVDSNVLVYALLPDPQFGPACQQLLKRIENHELQGFTSSNATAEMAHKLMTLEAAALLGRQPAGLANWLKRHPSEVRKLSQHEIAHDELAVAGIRVLPVTGQHVSLAADVSRQFGLLTNDALVVVVMQDHNLTHLASHDADFDRVPGLTRYAPA